MKNWSKRIIDILRPVPWISCGMSTIAAHKIEWINRISVTVNSWENMPQEISLIVKREPIRL